MNKLIPALLLFTAACPAVETGVDQPEDWYRWDVSHHGKHFIGGAAVGTLGYLAARGCGAGRFESWLVGTGLTTITATAYELRSAYVHPHNLVDPVDIGWTTLGGAGSSGVLAGLDYGVGLVLTPNTVALSFSMRL